MYGRKWRRLHNESWLGMQRMICMGRIEEVHRWWSLFRNTGHFTHMAFVSQLVNKQTVHCICLRLRCLI